MKCLQVSLRISKDEYLKMYQGVASTVLATTTTGQSIRFPANILQPYVTRDGVYGTFTIYFDGNNKFKEIKRIG